jgi:hypothetical protein
MKKVYSTQNNNQDIDFVIIWVDGSDPEWQKQREKYRDLEDKTQNHNEARFRDWGILKYWFRSVERYAPWVRRIHFVTCGQYPEWLNLEHPKLHFVKHEDYIPPQYLPTFSSFPIELNLHRINGLAERFVYFNDDMFVLAPVKPTDFFANGLPRDVAIRNIPMLYEIGHVNLNCINIINKEFAFSCQFKQHFWKWMNYRYGIHCLRNLFFLPFVEFTGAKNTHVANAYLKKTYNEVWEKYGDMLDKTCQHKFRCVLDLDQWLFKYWQIVSGNFYPQWLNYAKAYGIQDTNRLERDIKRKKTKLICLQDCEGWSDISELKKEVIQLFDSEFPVKSSFEL